MLPDMEVVGPLQIRVLHHLWTHGPCTVHAVHAALNAENASNGTKTMAYTTVLTVMRNLVRRNILAQVRGSRAHHFQPLIERRDYCQGMLRQARHELFQGDARALLAIVADDEQIDLQLRERIRSLVLERASA